MKYLLFVSVGIVMVSYLYILRSLVNEKTLLLERVLRDMKNNGGIIENTEPTKHIIEEYGETVEDDIDNRINLDDNGISNDELISAQSAYDTLIKK